MAGMADVIVRLSSKIVPLIIISINGNKKNDKFCIHEWGWVACTVWPDEKSNISQLCFIAFLIFL